MAVALVGVPLVLIVIMHCFLVGVVFLGHRHLARITALKADPSPAPVPVLPKP